MEATGNSINLLFENILIYLKKVVICILGISLAISVTICLAQESQSSMENLCYRYRQYSSLGFQQFVICREIDKDAYEMIELNARIASHVERIDEENQAIIDERIAAVELQRQQEEERAIQESLEKERRALTMVTAVQGDAYNAGVSDYEILARIIEAEATGLDLQAKTLVGDVVINRVNDGSFPNSITEVVFDGTQFSPTVDGRYYSVEITESSYEAAREALAGVDYSDGALYFIATRTNTDSSWHNRSLTYLFSYNGHDFYK